MNGKLCGHCELYLVIDEKRAKWYNELSKKNIILLEKVHKQEEIITNLQKRLIDRNNIININDASITANYFEQLLIKVDQNEDVCDEIKKALEKFEYKSKRYSEEKNQFKKMLLEKENDFSENVILYKEMAEYYRETLFKEMKDCHRIKNQLQETAKNLEIKQSHDLNNFPKNTDLLGKYKLLLKQHQSDLKTKEIIIDKLRKDRKMLYLKISQIKKDVEDRKEEFEIEIQKLKSTVAGWKEKCSKLKDLKQIS